MTINLRKLLPQQVPNQNITCSDCEPACPYECSYPEFTWPPQPPAHPPHTTNTNISPYFIIIVALLASAFLFITYYLIMVRCSTRFRPPPTSHSQELSDEEHGIEVDNPIWYITTIGLQPSVINSISVFKYEKHDNLIDVTNCSVCLNEFQDKETLRLLPKCNHAFHIPCIDTWLSSHTNCPLCRSAILSNTLSAILSPGDRSFSHRTGINQHTQIVSLDSDGDLGRNCDPESEVFDEIEDTKTEYESVTTERRSISVDSVAVTGIVAGEFEEGSGDSNSVIMSSYDGRE